MSFASPACLQCLRFLRVLLLAGLGWGLGAQVPGRIHLVAASQSNNPPYEYVDEQGRPAGYVNDLIRAVAQKENIDLEIRPMVWSEVRKAFDRGEVQAVTGMVFSEERAKVMNFTVPHSYVPYLLITRNTETRIRSERDLAGKEVLVLGQSIMAEHMDSMGLPYWETATHEQSILELSSGRADAALVPKYNFLYFTRKAGITNLRAVPSEVYPTKRCFAVQRGDAALLARLNEGLFLIQQDGTMDGIYQRHLGALEAAEVPLSVVLNRALKVILPIALLIVLTGILIWSITLKRQVDRRTAHLREALAEVRRLSGLIPICAHCKKIRDDAGYWQAVEGYISEHSEARFSHGLCPDCVKLDFPDFVEREPKPKEDLETWAGS